MKDYGRKPYISKDYSKMMKNTTDKQVFDQVVLKHSEMKKPYQNDTYEEMEHFFPTIYGGGDYPIPWFNFDDDGFDYHWMKMEDINDKKKICDSLWGKGWKGIDDYIAAGCPVQYVYPPCDITFTSNQMSGSSSQTLTACSECEFVDWELTGGGSLSTSMGGQTEYTAPATNPDCADNPTITARCNGIVVAQIKIAVNIVTASPAIINCCSWQNIPPSYWYQCHQYISCSGEVGGNVGYCSGNNSCNTGKASFMAYNKCSNSGLLEGINDVRSVAQKAAGCCPAQLL